MKATLLFCIFICRIFCAHAQNIYTISGNGTSGYNGDNIPAKTAQLYTPFGVFTDKMGNTFVVDRGNNRVRKINTNGIIETVAGSGIPGYNGDNILAINAKLNTPSKVVVDDTGNIYIADEFNFRIRKVSVATGLITTIAGTGSTGYNGDNIPAVNAQVSTLRGLALDTSGNIYFSDMARIRKINVATGIISTVAGNGIIGYNGDGIPATSAGLSDGEIAIDKMNNIFLADMASSRIRKIDGFTGIITTVAGNGSQGFNGDGDSAIHAELNGPVSIAIDDSENIFIGDGNNIKVRKVEFTTGIIATITGNGTSGYNGDSILAVTAQLAAPIGLYVNQYYLYICDAYNNRLRVIPVCSNTSPTLTIAAIPDTNITLGQQVTFTATPLNGGINPSYQWKKNNIAISGATTNTYITNTLANSDKITCTLHSTNPCLDSNNLATSNHLTIHLTTGIEPLSNNVGISIYPNPATNDFTVTSTNPVNNIKIMSISGSRAYYHLMPSGEKSTPISTSLPAGLYIVEVTTTDGRVIRGKLVIN